ncbi:MAG: hypothetical protein HYT80_07200 [Euryarchaeota archaeon]|nr:hypothetical protein [Euryarchaeota archaeon]
MSPDYSETSIIALSILMTVAVALGLYMTWLSWRAYRHTRDRAHRWLFRGMGLLTLGAVLEGFAYNILGWSLGWAQALGAAIIVGSFGSFVMSVR